MTLQILSASEGNILEDESAISVITEAKTLGNEISSKQKIAEETEVQIEAARTAYKPCGDYTAILFFCISGMLPYPVQQVLCPVRRIAGCFCFAFRKGAGTIVCFVYMAPPVVTASSSASCLTITMLIWFVACMAQHLCIPWPTNQKDPEVVPQCTVDDLDMIRKPVT